MALLAASNLSKSYGPNDIFTNISFGVPHKARIGLVGANGIGKTTLLRILAGEEEATSGKVQRAHGLRLGYLPQEAHFESEKSLWQICLDTFQDLLDRQAELSRLETAMSDPSQAKEALEIYGHKQHEFEHLGGYTYETRIRQTLNGLGFQSGDYERPLTQLSGGQRTRAFLAYLLLSGVELLLLDEPTNHLDIAAVEWLEKYLSEWSGTAVIVSHDRYFLDRAANTIWEMTPGLDIYPGNYSAYMTQRSEHYQRQLEEYQAQQEFIQKEEEYIRRNMAGQNTRQAQGRRKRLERLLEEARLTPPRQPRHLNINLKSAGRSGDLVLRTYQLEIGYHDEGRPLFNCPDIILRRGECAAIIGPNGAGKTTFLKTILAQIPPFRGEVDLGASLQIGYFAQANETLNPKNDLMQEIESVAPQMRPAEIRDYLARFLFTGDDVFKPITVLSGGERGRLALAKLALSDANLLLLDEPTNHLDLPSQEILQSVLTDYQGTILLVSHDRYLIDALASQIWDVDPRAGTLRLFEGSYSEYRQSREAEDKPQAVEPKKAADPIKAKQPANPNGISGHKRKKRLQELEEQIASLEAQLADLSRQLEEPPDDIGKVQQLGQEYAHLQESLDKLMAEWENLHKVTNA